jgi:(S)-3,5-dihydroxyphenylglycine transaminase
VGSSLAGARLMLALQSLHTSLSDPVLGSINFLNEVIDRYPQALSFAPGAPFGGFFDDLNLQAFLDRYVSYLRETTGLSPSAITRLLYQYGPSKGIINELLAETLERDCDIPVSPDAIVVTVGCQEAMLLTLRALMRDSGDALVVANPCFAGIVGAARLLDVPVYPVEEENDSIDLSRLQQICRSVRARGGRVRAVYVATDFANPSGSLLDLATRRRLIELAESEDFYVMEDSTYGFTSDEGALLPAMKALDGARRRVIYLGTFAKICAPGARVGFVVADQQVASGTQQATLLAAHIATIKSMVSVNTSPICQAIIGGMMLMHGSSIAALGRARAAFYRSNLRYLLAALDRRIGPCADSHPDIRWTHPQGGFFVRMYLPVPVDERLLEIAASRYGVLWTPMSMFYLENTECRQLRLSCSYLTPAQIDRGVARLALFLNDPACSARH